MFGATNPKPPPKKPGMPVKGDFAAKAKSQYDPNDMSIEGNLKRVIDEQSQQEEKKNDSNGSPGDVDAPLIRLVNALLIESVRLNASDIHIEPFENMLRVRFRIDGVLQEIQKVPHKLASAITTRLKILAELDICEKRLPQDGCIKFRSGDTVADFRMSTLPSAFGEKIVLRVMGTTSVNNNLSKLGIPEKELRMIRSSIDRPDGLILVTGPTGSGKTTTLYAALNELNDISESVFTAEDPIEGTLLGVTQCQVNSSVGYNFATILRSLLRQDPDVILVGEIRDQETAEISIKAALTGHLVLSTLHTNCAVSTISRLLNMGVAAYLITSSVNCVVAQRLVRRVCLECKHTRPVPPDLLEQIGELQSLLDAKEFAYGKGCPNCNGTGYKGRAPIYEVLTLSDEFRRMILAGASLENLRKQARTDGMTTLRESGVDLIRQGITTIEEVLGATNEDSENQQASPVSSTSVAVQNIVVPQQPTQIVTSAVIPKVQEQRQQVMAVEQPRPAAPVSGESKWKRK